MVNAQEWLDRKYPKEGWKEKWTDGQLKKKEWRTRGEVWEIYLNEPSLEGELDLKDFTYLFGVKVYISPQVDTTKLTIKNFPRRAKLNFEGKSSEYGWCWKCLQSNTSKKWCQPCAEKEWSQLEGQELIKKFIEQQGKWNNGKDKLKWIPYEKFTNIEHLADGGFSKIYKAECKEIEKKAWGSDYDVALKVLNNSQNITSEFLTEIANTNLVRGDVIDCHGISQDPTSKNYVMVMDYMKDGNLRQILQRSKKKELVLYFKLYWLSCIASGLNIIHKQNLVHRDFHSGNIVGGSITDLGLSRPVNYQKDKGEIFGVLPYVAPEVLRGQTYTKKSDVYSFGIIAYELLANEYPYPKIDDLELALAVCNGLRPDIDKVPLPQETKDLIKRCWDADSEKRPDAWELKEEEVWGDYSEEIEQKYNVFSQNTPYKIHSNAITTSKMIDTKQITERLKTMEYSAELAFDFRKLNLESNSDWGNINSNLTDELIKKWQELGFSYSQTQDWINAGLQPIDYNFCAWLRDIKQTDAEWVLNHGNKEQLSQEFFIWWQESQLQNQVEQPSK